MTGCWMQNGVCMEHAPEGYYGFIYCITDDKGRKYWGKKAFNHKRKTRLSKKAKLLAKTRKTWEIKQADSKWLSYWGSCRELLAYIAERGNTDGFTREVIKLCRDRASLSYWEVVTLIENEVLFSDNTWNGNIAGKYFRGKIHK